MASVEERTPWQEIAVELLEPAGHASIAAAGAAVVRWTVGLPPVWSEILTTAAFVLAILAALGWHRVRDSLPR